MKVNTDYLWHRKQGKKTATDTWEQHLKSQRKKLRKKLTVRIGGKPRTHDMDDEMYETIDKMLQSRTKADVKMAIDIVYNSNMKREYIDKLVTEHCNTLLYGVEIYGETYGETYISGALNTAYWSSNQV